jgi:hypothetical protein
LAAWSFCQDAVVAAGTVAEDHHFLNFGIQVKGFIKTAVTHLAVHLVSLAEPLLVVVNHVEIRHHAVKVGSRAALLLAQLLTQQ